MVGLLTIFVSLDGSLIDHFLSVLMAVLLTIFVGPDGIRIDHFCRS